jgi:peptidoglycan/xylan/chitin deacetylase (PgdA/CDA1 family)
MHSLSGAHGCMITFHRVAKADAWASLPDRNFYINLDFLDQLLSYLRATGWNVVTIDELLEHNAKPGRKGRLVNFSIDDCYKDTWEAAVPMFRHHDSPVTLFVTTGIPDRTILLGGAGLEDMIARSERLRFRGEVLDVASREAKRRAFARISTAWNTDKVDEEFTAFCEENAADPAFAWQDNAITWEMLDTLRDDPLVEIGAHTITHPRISKLSLEEARYELAESGQRLRTRLRLPVRHFAFPYGRSGDCGPRDFALARLSGFQSASTTRKGLLAANQNPFSLPRNTLNGGHQKLLMVDSTLSGLTGLAAKVMGRV